MNFVDVDFTQCNFPLGYIPELGEQLFSSSLDELANFSVIPSSEWEERSKIHQSLSAYIRQIKNQLSEGSCVSNAFTQAMEVRYNYQVGVAKWIKLSAISLYKRCGRSPGSGSMLSTNLSEAQNIGVLVSKSSPNASRFPVTFPDTGFYTQFPSNWKTEAAYFRILESFSIKSLEEFITCLFLGWPVIYARASHCIMATDLVRRNNAWYVKYANSWGDWGDQGYGYDSLRTIENAAYGSIAIKQVSLHPSSYEETVAV